MQRTAVGVLASCPVWFTGIAQQRCGITSGQSAPRGSNPLKVANTCNIKHPSLASHPASSQLRGNLPGIGRSIRAHRQYPSEGIHRGKQPETHSCCSLKLPQLSPPVPLQPVPFAAEHVCGMPRSMPCRHATWQTLQHRRKEHEIDSMAAGSAAAVQYSHRAGPPSSVRAPQRQKARRGPRQWRCGLQGAAVRGGLRQRVYLLLKTGIICSGNDREPLRPCHRWAGAKQRCTHAHMKLAQHERV